MADLATLQTRLLEAELAYHKLMTGAQAVSIEHGDMKTDYFSSVTSMQMLTAYIETLKSQIAQLGGTSTGLRRRAIAVDSPGTC